MTMVTRKWLALTLGAGLLAGANRADAGDVIRLGGSAGPVANTQSLALRGDDADTQLVYRGGGHGGHGGHYGGGHYGGGRYGGHYAHYGHYGNYGHYGARYSYGYGYRPYYYGAYYRPYYSSYYQPYYYPSYTYYPSYYYTPSYYVYPSYYAPCAETTIAAAPTVTLRAATGTYSPPTYVAPRPATSPGFMPPAGDGTYRYDGGPVLPMPLPSESPAAPTVDPKRPTVPRDGLFVSIPSTPKVSYPAYGETTPARPTPSASTALVSTPAPAATTPRLVYPAYGDGRR